MSHITDLHAATIIIPTKNRKDVLCETIRSVLCQTVKVEVLVMDDGSTDGTGEFLRHQFPVQQFPMVVYHRGESSLGPAFRRNQGAEIASTAFLFTIDDDCLVPSPNTFQQTIDAFDLPQVGAVTIPFINVKQDSKTHYLAPDRRFHHLSFMFFGGMVAFRREAYRSIGGYRTFYFMHVEEPDLSIRLYNSGYVIRLGWADPIHHLESPIRNRRRLHSLGPRNFVLYEWYNAPLLTMLYRLPIATVSTLAHTIKIGAPHLGALGLLRGYAGIFHEWKKRAPVRSQVYSFSRQFRKTSVKLEDMPDLLHTSPI